MAKCYPIEIIDSTESILYYPKEFGQKDFREVAFGSLCIDTIAKPQPSNKHKISVSKTLKDQLHIPNIPLKLYLFERDQTLFIGPIIGIFTAGFTTYPQSPIGNRSYSFSKLISGYERIGVLPVIFGIQHIDWKKGLIDGFFFHEGEWRRLEVPIPNVIYDRLPNRKVENLQMIQELKSKLAEEYIIPWYNPGFFNKLDIYKKLVKRRESAQYLPKTIPFHNINSLKQMLEEFGYVYVKPINGSLGKGVLQIRQTNDNKYYCRYRDEEGNNRLMKIASIPGIIQRLFSKGEHEKYIIQQGISLMEVNHHFADFRIHTNKGLDGEWKVTAIGCKVAGDGSPTTHLYSGGSVLTLEEIFPVKEIRTEKLKHLVAAVIRLSKDLEKQFDGVLAEIGFDIGMDEKGNIWMFEANSKPGRAIFSHPKIRRYERYTHRLVLSYAVHLTEQVIRTPEKFFHDLVLQ
ncbi:YheC/YheD family protein [Caldibacillus lycopersici]|uniref:YheC/YheD family protein n=1 Tax=Perspicuibacillus lycopersici TaxID=1325689 RepID=A0AAE3LPQ1_9BACI|nr:YheC/YheD family protein [Perspicuibacillus lycopersici]MCU9612534.1 YheC/YheD family protein [Perspicuibacillus lycopersici]